MHFQRLGAATRHALQQLQPRRRRLVGLERVERQLYQGGGQRSTVLPSAAACMQDIAAVCDDVIT